jgi:hypothetical protein
MPTRQSLSTETKDALEKCVNGLGAARRNIMNLDRFDREPARRPARAGFERMGGAA